MSTAALAFAAQEPLYVFALPAFYVAMTIAYSAGLVIVALGERQAERVARRL